MAMLYERMYVVLFQLACFRIVTLWNVETYRER